MGALMHDALGVGLAATQLGILHRVLVYRVDPEDDAPRWSIPFWSGRATSGGRRRGLPEPPRRARGGRASRRVKVRARDARGQELQVEAEGLTARVIQHEIDHLDGVLILDRISREARKEAMRAMREATRVSGRPAAPRARARDGHSLGHGHGARRASRAGLPLADPERREPRLARRRPLGHGLPRHVRVRRGGAGAACGQSGPSPGAGPHPSGPPPRPWSASDLAPGRRAGPRAGAPAGAAGERSTILRRGR